MTNPTKALLLVALVACALRLPWIWSPYSTYVDEGHIVRRAQTMYRYQTSDPLWYGYGSGLMNLARWTCGIVGVDPSTVATKPEQGAFTGKANELRYGVQDRRFLWGARLWAALAGVVAAVAVAWRFVREDPVDGLVAGLLMAVLPLSVEYSLYACNDMPICACCAVVLAASSPLVLGAACGAAVCFKAPGILLVPIALVKAWKGAGT